MDGLLSAHNKVKNDVLYRVMLLAITLSHCGCQLQLGGLW